MVSHEDLKILEDIQERLLSLPLPQDTNLSKVLNESIQCMNALIVAMKSHEPKIRRVPDPEKSGFIEKIETGLWINQRIADEISQHLQRIFDYIHVISILHGKCEYCQLENRIPAKVTLHALYGDEEWVENNE